jgi:ubiquinone/menaquinone biosynthesis C-methylase UbiE
MNNRTAPKQPKTYSVNIGMALLRQCRKPSGWIGRLTLRRMNRSHARLTEWGLTHATVAPHHTVLDVGCGGGRTVARLAAMATGGKTYGVDYSAASVAAAVALNRRSVREGRVEIVCAAVSHLPFPDAMFDVITAVETHYYWPDLPGDLGEVLRVLKPGGALLIVAESYKGGKYDAVLRRVETLQQRGIMTYAHLTVGEHRELLATAGYTDVQVFEEYDKGWLCALARRSHQPSG